MDILRKEFVEKCEKKFPGKRINENIWKLFKRFYESRSDFDRCFTLAEEINALVAAIESLDEHVAKMFEFKHEIDNKIG